MMGKRVWAISGLCLVLGCGDPVPADRESAIAKQEALTASKSTTSSTSNESPRELLDLAFAAYGGDSARQKLKSCRITIRCVVPIPAAVDEMGGDTFVMEDCFLYPDKWRRTVRRESDGTETALFVVNVDNHWAKSPGKKVQAMPLPAPNMRKPAILATLDQLMGLRESKESMTVGPPEEIAGCSVIPLTILSGGRPQSTSYFDCSTNLIVKEAKYYLPGMHEPPETWKDRGPVATETTYGDYKSFEGVILPTRMVVSQAGKTVLDTSVLRVEFPSEFDARLFDKPLDE